MGNYGTFDWPYFYLDQEGFLHYDDGSFVEICDGVKFKNSEEAEQYLIDNYSRGNVQ